MEVSLQSDKIKKIISDESNTIKENIVEELEQLRTNILNSNEESILKIDRLIEQCNEYGLDEELVDSMQLKSQMISTKGDYELAIATVEKAISLAEQIESPFLRGLTNNQCGVIHFNYSFFDKAIAQFLKASDYFKLTDQHQYNCKSIRNVGIAYLRKSEYIKSQEYLNKALHCAGEYQLKDVKATILSWLGILENEQANYDKAVEHLIESNDILYEIKDFFNYAVNLNIIALTYIYSKTDIAIDYLKQAEEISRQYEYYYILADVTHNFGLAYYEQGNYEKSLEKYFESLEYGKRSTSIDKTSNTYHNIGDVYNSLNQHDLAMEYLQKALKIRKDANHKYRIAESYISIASTYLLQGLDDEALEACNMSMEYAVEFNNANQLSALYKVYSTYYEKRGNFKTSYEFYTLYREESNKSNREKVSRNYLNIKKRYELGNIERNAKIKEQEEALKGSIAMAITANHHLNQPLTVLQGNMDLIVDRLQRENIIINQESFIQTQAMIENIRVTLIKFRRNA
jgi:tetratricopeptide (TPR) repeat protein